MSNCFSFLHNNLRPDDFPDWDHSNDTPTRVEDVLTEEFISGLEYGKYCRWARSVTADVYRKFFYVVGYFADAGPFDPEDISTWNMTHLLSLHAIEKLYNGRSNLDVWDFTRRVDFCGIKVWPNL
eukprot:TRINITY_DN1251_c0_g1_i4.p1 TRINITY_DN1251_c0_g1~~TRINITY_DN1251_c0_g1_i4.p1  ORF type:complete len:125 (+),score=15.40 TRINITY_DN1251_c0_g1_i4:541-915(+)